VVALVDRAAMIDWWCGRRLDDDPSLWRLLDQTGGAERWLRAIAIDQGEVVAGRR